jgi:hypothetical protein
MAEGGIADGLRIEAALAHAPVILVFGIGGIVCGIVAWSPFDKTRLSMISRMRAFTDQPLVHEAEGEVVKKFGVARASGP